MHAIAKRYCRPLRMVRSCFACCVTSVILSLLLLSEASRLPRDAQPTWTPASSVSRDLVWDNGSANQSEQAPNASVDNVQINPQVALMFLVRDKLPLEPVWTAFIAAAAELSLRAKPHWPRMRPSVQYLPDTFIDPTIAATACWQFSNGTQLIQMPTHKLKPVVETEPTWNMAGWLPDRCASTTGSELYAQQDLFSIYVHRSVSARPFPGWSVFSGRAIRQRTRTVYASPSLVTALRLLLRAALSNPRNDKFVLLSESDIPLYHPALIWTQLTVEENSRTMLRPRTAFWLDAMATAHLQREQFKKASQWVSLTRRHANIAAYDNHVYPVMTAYCRTEVHCSVTNLEGRKRARFCTSDEHYVPTVLAAYGESLVNSSITYAKFYGGWSPKGHGQETTVQDVYTMRAGEMVDDRCDVLPKAAMRTAAQLFIPNKTCTSFRANQGQSRASQTKSNVLGLQRRTARPRSMKRRPRHLTALQKEPDQHAMAESNVAPDSGHESSSTKLTYDEMPLHCPLFGRKFSADALKSLQNMIWRCDGLGYSFDCLSQVAGETRDE